MTKILLPNVKSELHRNHAVESVVLHVEGQQLRLKPGVPRRNKPHYTANAEPRPFKIPVTIAGDIQLHLSINPQSKAGEGRCANIYDATVDSVLSSSGVPNGAFPPLVVKVAHWMKQDLLSREAWNYNEMASLQGVCIPRCYGFFEVEGVTTCPLWGDSIHAEVIKFTRVNQGRSSDPVETESAKDYLRIDGRQDVLSILILEKMGDRIPTNPAPAGIIKELAYIYDELAHLRILHGDVRYENVLAAPDWPKSLPGLPSPQRDRRVHKWRLIDFGLASSTNQTLDMLRNSYSQELMTISSTDFGVEVKQDDVRINEVRGKMV